MKNKTSIFIFIFILLLLVIPSVILADDILQQFDLELILQEKEDDENYIFNDYIEYDVDNEENIYISQPLPPTPLISKFDKNGKFLFNIGKKGMGPGEYKMPFARVMQDQILYVWDRDRIHFFKLDGSFIKTVQNKLFIGNYAKSLGNYDFIEFRYDSNEGTVSLFMGNLLNDKTTIIDSEKAKVIFNKSSSKKVLKGIDNAYRFAPGPDGLIIFTTDDSKIIRGFKNGKKWDLFTLPASDAEECFILDIIVDNKSDIWMLYKENKEYYLARYSIEGKIKGKFKASSKDKAIAPSGGIHFIGDYMYLMVYNSETGNKIYRTKIY